MAAEQVGWCVLPEDILLLILERLPLPDYIQVGAVCTTWHFVASKKRCPPAPQLPWLMLPDNNNHNIPNVLHFFRFSPRRLYKFDMPRNFSYLTKCWIGSYLGWLVIMYKNSQMYLINPISQSLVRLPPATKLPYLQDEGDRDINGGFFNSTKPMHKAVFLPPNDTGDYIVLGIYDADAKLAYCKCGYKIWIPIEDAGRMYSDIIYFKGKFYGVNIYGRVIACDLSGNFSKVEEIGPLNEVYGWKFLVESKGDLLMVVRNINYMRRTYTSCFPFMDHRFVDVIFYVFKLDERENQWLRVKNLGDRALFLGLSASISISTQEVSDCKANCIYFADEKGMENYKFDKNWSKNAGIYHLEDGSIEPYYHNHYPFRSSPAIWFRPNTW